MRLDVNIHYRSQAKQAIGDLNQVATALNKVRAAAQMPISSGRQSILSGFNQQLKDATKNSGIFVQEFRSLRTETDAVFQGFKRGKMSFTELSMAMRNFQNVARRHARFMQATFATTGMDEFGRRTGSLIIPDRVISSWQMFKSQIRTAGSIAHHFSGEMIRMGKNIQWAGRQVVIGFFVPITFAANEARKAFMGVEEELVRLIKVYDFQGGNIVQQNEQVKRSIQELSSEAASAFALQQKEVVEVAANYAQMGHQLEETGGILEHMTTETLRAATLGEIELGTATEFVRSTQAVFQLSTEELTQTLNEFNAIENQTALNTKDLAQAFPEVAPVARQLGASAGFTASMLAAMVEKGIAATEAAHALKFGLSRLIDPTDEAAKKWQQFANIDIANIFEQANGDLKTVLQILANALDGIEDGQRRLDLVAQLVGRRQAARFINLMDAVTEAQNGQTNAFSRANDVLGKHAENAKTAAEELDTLRASASFIHKQLKAELNVELAKMGEMLAGTFNVFLEKLVGVLKAFNELEPQVQKMILGLFGFAAALSIGTMGLGLFMNLGGQALGLITRFIPQIGTFNTEMAALRAVMQGSANIADESTGLFAGLARVFERNTAATRTFKNSFEDLSDLTHGGKMRRFMDSMGLDELDLGGGKKIGKVGASSANLRLAGGGTAPLSALIAGQAATDVGLHALLSSDKDIGVDAAADELAQVAESRRRMRADKSGGFFRNIGGFFGRAFEGIRNIDPRDISTLPFTTPSDDEPGIIFRGAQGARQRVSGARSSAAAAIPGRSGFVGGRRAKVHRFMPGLSGRAAQAGGGFSGWIKGIAAATKEGIFTALRTLRGSKIAGLLKGGLKLGIITTAITAIISEWDKFRKGFQETFNNEGAIGQVFQRLKDLIQGVREMFSGGEVKETLQSVAEIMGKIVGWIANVLAPLLLPVMNALERIVQFLGAAIVSIGKFLTQLFEGDFAGALWTLLKDILIDVIVIEGGKLIGGLFVDLMEMIGRLLGRLLFDLVIMVLNVLQSALAKIPGVSETFMQGAIDQMVDWRDGLFRVNKELDNTIEKFDTLHSFMEQISKESLQDIEDKAADIRVKLMNAGIQFTKLQERHVDYAEQIGVLNEEEAEWMRKKIKLQEAMNELKLVEAELSKINTAELVLQQGLKFLDLSERQDELRGQIKTLMANLSKTAGTEAIINPDDSLDADTDAAESRAKNYISALRNALKDQLKSVRDDAIDAFEEYKNQQLSAMDEEIEKIQEVGEEEQKLDRLREQLARKHELRRQRELFNITQNIQIDAAMAEGKLDDAAVMREELYSENERFAMEMSKLTAEQAKERRKIEREEQIKALEEQRDAMEEHLDKQQELLEEQLDMITKFAPKSQAEFNAILGQVNQKLGEFTDGVAQLDLAGAWDSAFSDMRAEIANDEMWEKLGDGVGAAFGEGVMNSLDEIIEAWRRGELPEGAPEGGGGPSGGDSGGGSGPGRVGPSVRVIEDPKKIFGRPTGLQEFHKGGLAPDEVPAVLQAGEFVMRRDAVKRLGQPFLEGLNRMHHGGAVESPSAMARTLGNKDMFKSLTGAMLEKMWKGEGMRGGAPSSPSEILGGEFKQEGKWPPRSWGKISGNTARALNFIRGAWESIVSAFAGVNRGDPKSDHSYGKAIDVMVTKPGTMPNASQEALGWQIANWFIRNPGSFGTKYVIWDKLINSGGGWKEYTRYGKNPGPTLGHFDHVHISFLHDGGMVGKLPSLARGGFVNQDTLANVHKGEAVLTSPLTRQLIDGIRSMEHGGGGVHVDVHVQELYGDREFVELLANRVGDDVAQKLQFKGKNYGRRMVTD